MIITLILSLISSGLTAQTDWKLRRDEDGIKVFSANAENSEFKIIRVECIIKSSFSQLIAFLLDVEQQHEWIYNNKSTSLLKRVKDNEVISYSEYSIPWPCCNRDYISHITINQQTPQLVTIDSKAEPDLLPLKHGKVRVKKSVAHWDVTAMSNDLLKIVYTVNCDPAGAIPAWLTNMFVAKGPFQTFQKLRTCVAGTKYQQAHFDFIRDQPKLSESHLSRQEH